MPTQLIIHLEREALSVEEQVLSPAVRRADAKTTLAARERMHRAATLHVAPSASVAAASSGRRAAAQRTSSNTTIFLFKQVLGVEL